MRFGEHFCAALVYKRGKFRGFCVKIVLDFCFGAVGFLVNGAQRAFGGSGSSLGGDHERHRGERGTRRALLV